VARPDRRASYKTRLVKRPRLPKLKRSSLRRPGFGRGAGKPKAGAKPAKTAKGAKAPAKATKKAAKPAS
jgi:hypothetical protein